MGKTSINCAVTVRLTGRQCCKLSLYANALVLSVWFILVMTEMMHNVHNTFLLSSNDVISLES